VTTREIVAISRYLGISEEAFIQSFTRLRSNRDGLALVDGKDGACCFYENNSCQIQAFKPQQCRDFPNLWGSREDRRECKAIPMEVSEEQYRIKIREATGRIL